MKTFIKSNIMFVIGALVGSIGGFLYWQYIGCASGTCSITSKPLNSSLYGALCGALLFGAFKK